MTRSETSTIQDPQEWTGHYDSAIYQHNSTTKNSNKQLQNLLRRTNKHRTLPSSQTRKQIEIKTQPLLTNSTKNAAEQRGNAAN